MAALSLEKICSSSDFFHDSLPTVFSIYSTTMFGSSRALNDHRFPLF